MLISQKQLKKVIVETHSGQLLGYVVGFDLETDTGVIEKYYVKGRMMIAGLWEKSLIINKAQIINFDEDKMVVDDAVVKVKANKIRGLTQVEKLEGSESIISSEADNL